MKTHVPGIFRIACPICKKVFLADTELFATCLECRSTVKQVAEKARLKYAAVWKLRNGRRGGRKKKIAE